MAKKSDQFKQENSKDKRVRGSVKKLAAKLWELLTPKQIGKKLGVSTQKATAIKKGINSGKIYSPEVKKILEKEVKRAEPKKKKTTEGGGSSKTKVKIIKIEPFETLMQIVSGAKDKRTLPSVQKEIKYLFENFNAAEIAEKIGLANYQQAVALRKRVENGESYSPELRDLLREAREKLESEYKIVGKEGEIYYPSTKALNKDYTGYKTASYAHNSYESALKWWKGVTGGAGYFVILRKKSKKTGREIFYVMDIDPDRKRPGKGKKSKKINNYQTDRALKLEEKFLETEDY